MARKIAPPIKNITDRSHSNCSFITLETVHCQPLLSRRNPGLVIFYLDLDNDAYSPFVFDALRIVQRRIAKVGKSNLLMDAISYVQEEKCRLTIPL